MKKIILILLVGCILSGCQDKKNLLNLLFPSSMGIDYQDGKYTIIFQIDNLNTVSKSELESPSQQNKSLIAMGEGKSIEEAMSQIEEMQRSVINLSHIRTLVLLKGALNKEVEQDICNYTIQNPELRCDTDVYYSEEDKKKIFDTNFQVSRSQLYTLTNSPEFKKVSMLMRTINLMQLSKALENNDITVAMPILKIDDKKDTYITQDGQSEQKVYHIDELLYTNPSQETQKKISFDDLKGIQWVKSHQNSIDVTVQINNKDVHAYSSKVKVQLVFNPKDETYHLVGNIHLVVTRDLDLRPIEELQPHLEKEIHDQIKKTFEKGLENNLDIYNMHYLSRLFGKDVQPSKDNFFDDTKVKLAIKGSYISKKEA